MTGIVERIGSLAGTELAKAINLAHRFYNERMGIHGHTGRALVETVAEVARSHPNLVGIGAGLLVEQLLAEEKRRHDAHLANGAYAPNAPTPGAQSPQVSGPSADAVPGYPSSSAHGGRHLHLPELHSPIRLNTLRPGRVAVEVFGAILLLKLASTGAKMFRHKHQEEIWFAPAARVRLWSASIASYYFIKSLRSPKISAWRNAAVALFATDALKPVLRGPKRKKGGRLAAAPAAVPSLAHTPEAAAAPAPQDEPLHEPFAAPPAPPPPAPLQHEVDPSAVSTFGTPKADPRPMPVWPSETKKPAPSPVAVATHVSAPPPIGAHEGPFPPG